MKEIRDIIRAHEEAKQQGKRTALATVVHVEGSSYRRPGARMLITEDGKLTGAISGGCLEGDALRKALLVLMQQRPLLVTYDTMDEDDEKLGIGLGCNGIIQVLIEPIDESLPSHPITLLRALLSKRQRAVLVTLFSLHDKKNIQPGSCLLLQEEGTITGNLPVLQEVIRQDAFQALGSGQSLFRTYISDTLQVTAFFEFLAPPISVIVIGAGNDVVPLVAMATTLGWQTTVVDSRSRYAKTDRFASGCQLWPSRPDELIETTAIDEQTVFLLMTHNYHHDLAALKMLLAKEVVYIGMLGPKKKRERMVAELRQEGMELSSQQLASVHSPAGLDIGAETPEEIALAILAEIKTVLAGRNGSFLRKTTDVLHARNETIIDEVRLPRHL